MNKHYRTYSKEGPLELYQLASSLAKERPYTPDFLHRNSSPFTLAIKIKYDVLLEGAFK